MNGWDNIGGLTPVRSLESIIMKQKICFPAFVLLALSLFVTTADADMVRVYKNDLAVAGSDPNAGQETLTGKIRDVAAESVTLLENNKERIVPANLVVWIQYDKEPVALTTARTLLQAGAYDEAIAKLAEITPAEQRNMIEGMQAENDFITAYATAMKSLTAGNSEGMLSAGKLLKAFVDKYPKSYHIWESNLLIGEMLVALKRPEQAQSAFEQLAKAPWSDLQLQAQIALGQLALEQNEDAKARQLFEKIVAFTGDTTPRVTAKKSLAKIGLAQILIRQDKSDEAVAQLKELIDTVDNSDPGLMAKLYNTLGEAHEKGGNPQAAILDYLHTDLLYSTAKVEHVKSLQALARLWKQSRPDRAAEVTKRLKDSTKQ